MTGGVSALSGANAQWVGLFNNGTRGEWLLLRDMRLTYSTSGITTSRYQQGTFGGTPQGQTYSLDVNAPALAGQVYSGNVALAQNANVPGFKLWIQSQTGLAFQWYAERPLAAIPPGWMYMFFSTFNGATVTGSFEWLVVDPKELS